MLRFIIKRLLLFIPTLLVISLVSFGLSKVAPGDPVDLLIGGGGIEGRDLLDAERVYRETAHFLGLDQPAFYFTLTTQAYPDTLHRIVNRDRRKTLKRLIGRYGNWPEIQNYYHALRRAQMAHDRYPDSLRSDASVELGKFLQQLNFSYAPSRVEYLLTKLKDVSHSDSQLNEQVGRPLQRLNDAYRRVEAQAKPGRHYLPKVIWHGAANQYHRWISDFVRADFGISYVTGSPVGEQLREALGVTLLLNGTAILLAYLLAVPLGVTMAVRRDTVYDRLATIGLFILYSLPSFWIATLLVLFVTTPEYGMDWFPTMGLGHIPEGAGLGQTLRIRMHHLFLPVFCLTYGFLAFISRQMRGGMLDTLQQDYIRTARAKGLPERRVIWKHAFRNALFPIITLLASVFPAALGGSFVIEYIFNIPGMGKLTIDSIYQQDWPVLYAVLMLGAVLTMGGILLADLLYALVDPRVKYGQRNH